ncbi:MAG: hypothetical protein A4E20_10745 [Nitrospira sp. SG-bin2]|nr:MAG: hypothetical protein A4E20_10745 [Nitrospira sp. SG-bin2]
MSSFENLRYLEYSSRILHMRVGVYLRQSLDRTGEGLAVSRQREDCVKLCDQRGWTPVFYEDNDTSATKGVRPAYQNLLEDAEKGVIKGVVVWDLDRLHRRPIELEHFMELADRKRLSLATVTGDVDLSTDNGRLFARIKGAVAKAEVERKSARQKRAARQAAEAGHGWGGRRAFGYDPDDLPLEPEASLLRGAYKKVLSGISLHAIAAEWNRNGINTTAGKKWTGSTVRQVLINPRNAGWRSYRGEIVADATWEPITTEDTWRAVASLLNTPGRRAGTNARKRLLTGILICGRCEHPMRSGVSHTSNDPIYVCKNCHRNSRRLDPVDGLVIKLVKGFLSSPLADALLVNPNQGNLEELRNEEAGLIGRLKQLGVDYAEGLLNGREVKTARERLETRLSDIREQLINTNDQVFEGLIRTDFKWDSLHLDRQRSVIRKLFVPTLLPAGRGRPFQPDHLSIRWLPKEH